MVGMIVMCLSYVMCTMLKIETNLKKEGNKGKNNENKIAASAFVLYWVSYWHIKPVCSTVLNRHREEMVLHIFLSVYVGSYFVGMIKRRPTGLLFCICYLLLHDSTKPPCQHTKQYRRTAYILWHQTLGMMILHRKKIEQHLYPNCCQAY